MAIYHCTIKIVKRSQGKSAIAAAAYRSGEKLTNEWDGETHDYTKKGGIVHTEILLPTNAPPTLLIRSELWNSVELFEKNSDAQLAREIEIALPVELDRKAQLELVRTYVNDTFVSVGMCADFALHDKGDGTPHAHILLTLRPLNKDGTWGAKCYKEYDLNEQGQRIRLPSGAFKSHHVNTTDWNDKGKAELWRSAWADYLNREIVNQNKLLKEIKISCESVVFVFLWQSYSIGKACDNLLQEVNFQSTLGGELVVFLKLRGEFNGIFCHSFRSAKS